MLMQDIGTSTQIMAIPFSFGMNYLLTAVHGMVVRKK